MPRSALHRGHAARRTTFSPFPIDIPDAPKTALLDVLLTRSHDLNGGEVSEPDQALWSGNPDADPTNSYEIAVVTIDESDQRQKQGVSDWTAGSDTLTSVRADLAAWVMSARNSALIRGSGWPDAVWIYVGSGRTDATTADGTLEVGQLGAGGDLGTLVAEESFSGLWGLGAGASNDQLYTFGGTTSSSGNSAALCGSPPATPVVARRGSPIRQT